LVKVQYTVSPRLTTGFLGAQVPASLPGPVGAEEEEETGTGPIGAEDEEELSSFPGPVEEDVLIMIWELEETFVVLELEDLGVLLEELEEAGALQSAQIFL
jgi:hypothetical protein